MSLLYTRDLDYASLHSNVIVHDYSKIHALQGRQRGNNTYYINNMAVVSISKCASISVNDILSDYRNQYNEEPAEYVIPFRDPINRWISGVCQYHALNPQLLWNIDVDQLSGSYFNLLLTQKTFDDHTERQSWFLQNLDISKFTLIVVNDQFTHNFCKKLMIPIHHVWKNKTTNSQLVKLKEKLYDVVNQGQNRKMLEEWFWIDYWLLNSCTVIQ